MKKIFVFIICILVISCFSEKSENQSNETDSSLGQEQKAAQIFNRIQEPKENAFSILVPKGWKYEGGIFRVNPINEGPSNAIEAKLDFAVKKDNDGSVMLRWLPDMLYFDARYSPAGQMGMFPPGSNYQGMTVWNILSPEEFVIQFVIPYAHPNAQNVQVVQRKHLAKMSKNYSQRVLTLVPYMTFSYQAGMVTINYSENGTNYEERIVTVIENWGAMGAGMWGNKETFFIRGPKGELKDWEAVFSIIQNSVKVNSQWLAGELKGQIQRGEIVLNTQREVQKIEREIVEHRQKTNAEIHNDMFLTLTDQEEYVNPYTNEIETGSNQWKHRWVNESGDVIYTDTEEYDPNVDINLNRSDYKRTPIRKRLPND